MDSHTNLPQKTISGVIWSFMEQLLRQGTQVVTTLLLTWFLVPADFGLMALVSVFFTIANSLMESGFTQALIRKKEVSQIDYSTIFYTNVTLGFLAYVLLFVLAPFIADFYNEPRLVLLVRLVGLVVIINSFQIVQIADLARKLNFKIQFGVTLPAAILSGIIAVSMAALGFGIWSLAAQMLVSSLAITLLYWVANSWRPSKVFSSESFYEMFGFGSKLLLSSIINTVFNNLYIITIGKLFSTTLLGYYYIAQQIQVIVVSQLISAVDKVSLPALATLQTDSNSLKLFFRRIIQIVTYLVSPCMLGLAVLAEPLFRVMLKDDWLPAVPYLQLFCIIGLIYPLHAINLNILIVKGRSDLFLYLEIVKKIIIVFFLLVSIPYGIFGMLIGQIVSSVLCYLPNSYFSIKLIGYSVPEQLLDFFPTLIISIFMGLFIYLIGEFLPFHGFAFLFVSILLGFIFYIVANYLVKIQAQLILWQILKERYGAYR